MEQQIVYTQSELMVGLIIYFTGITTLFIKVLCIEYYTNTINTKLASLNVDLNITSGLNSLSINTEVPLLNDNLNHNIVLIYHKYMSIQLLESLLIPYDPNYARQLESLEVYFQDFGLSPIAELILMANNLSIL